nr:hypothetical protein [uncultured Kingella sp.]
MGLPLLLGQKRVNSLSGCLWFCMETRLACQITFAATRRAKLLAKQCHAINGSLKVSLRAWREAKTAWQA